MNFNLSSTTNCHSCVLNQISLCVLTEWKDCDWPDSAMHICHVVLQATLSAASVTAAILKQSVLVENPVEI
jgi:hypothetical protein